MADLIELAAEYRVCGLACKEVLKKLSVRLCSENLREEETIEIRRRITLVTAMARECLATSNYLKKYDERRRVLEQQRQEIGV